jgi:hypothetical protein
MALSPNAVPMRWASGPLEIALRGKTDGFTPQHRQTLERFHDPASLEILKDSPIDCLLLSWAAGLPEDAVQQKSATALVAAARQRNLAVVGWVKGSADHAAAIAAARAAGLAAVAMQDFRGQADFPVIPWGERAKMPWDAPGPLLAATGNVWPGVTMAGFGDNAGPTAVPWLDSNGWFVQMARARTQKPLWLMFDPPGKGRVLTAANYQTAICDAEITGGRWAISLDDTLRAGLTEGNATARDTFSQIGETIMFFKKHADWRTFRPLGAFGVVSDFAGDNYDMSGEILNLAARRNLQFRVIWKSQALEQPFKRLKAILYADKAAPGAQLRRKLMDFAQQGGLLITGPQWGPAGTPADPGFDTQFAVRNFGKGRLAVAKGELTDAYQVAVEAQFLVSHANDLVKIYNSSSSGCTLVMGSPDGKRALVQVLAFATGRGSSARTVWVREKYRAASLWSIGAAAPLRIEPVPADEYFGVECQIPSAIPGYFALEFAV